MKNIILAIGFAMAGLCSTAQIRVIDYPVTGVRTTESLDFYQIEISDTAVILKGNMYSRPNTWVSIASSSVLKGVNTGKNYRLIRATGITLDKREFMPASWNRSFTLQFEPVDSLDKLVDFDEMLSNGNSFRINGIALEKKEPKKKLHCRIEGSVIDNPAYSRLMLMPENTDTRVQEWISIPVSEGKFSYDLYTDNIEPYELYSWSDQMSGSWRPVSFFSENGKIELTLYSAEQEPKIHSNSPYTHELLRFQKELNDKYWTPLQKKTEKREREIVILEMNAHIDEYIQSKPTLVGLYMLVKQARRMRDYDKSAPYKDLYKKIYAGKFEDNPMTDYMRNWIVSKEIKVGDKYLDFTAPDLIGKQHTLSKEIKGKVALIDFWASWCGPCRRASISMIPVYEVYKDKGFVIVGVARERDAERMEKAIAKDKYPWLNLLELNDAGKIWERYGIGNAGGRTYLVDKKGKILAIHPTAEEVKAWLEKLL